MYERELENLGLSEKEAKVYLASLELGPETIQNIARKADINRPTTYLQVGSLKEKGLMSEFQKGKKTFYSPESPGRLVGLLGELERDIQFKKAETQKIIPILTSLFTGTGERPKVRFFEGLVGARAMQEDLLALKNKRSEGFTNLDKLFEVFPKHEDEYTKRRVANGIEVKVIYTRKAGPVENADDAAKLRKTKFIAADRFPITADVTMFDDKVALVTYKAKPVGVIIEDKDIADAMRAIFYLIWNSS